MAKSTSSSAPNPFASAQRKAPAGAKKSDAPIYPAADTKTYDGGDYKRAQIVESINAYASGHEMFEQGKAMKDTSRPTILVVARTLFARDWLNAGKRPSSPALVTDANTVGTMLKVIFMDSVKKLDEGSYGTLANLIGAANAEQLTVKRDDFQINPEFLDQTVDVKKDGKVVKQNVMQAIAEALQDKFAPSPHVTAGLFTVVPRFETVKGLIDKGPNLVCPDKSPASAARLAQFLEVAGFTTQIKTGATGAD